MSRIVIRHFLMALLIVVSFGATFTAAAQALNVVAKIEVVDKQARKGKHAGDSGDVVVWLKPLAANLRPTAAPKVERYRLVQRDKQFTPHLLVVPVGSSVDFPNLDPFYHNVFSLFNGKRFDLGLYEAGSTRAVHFDHEGVSYIFCNIHPEMGAVVIALSTRYFGMSSADGGLTIRDVPDGTYELNVWAEGARPEQLANLTRVVRLSAESRDLGTIPVVEDTNPMDHKNKFGEEYAPAVRPY